MIREENLNTPAKQHNIIIENREKISISGVEDVDSFDERIISMSTSRGLLILRGSNLHIDKLSLETGDVNVTGLVTELGYEETSASGSLWARLFK
jgi:sporulation protein YabP